MPSPNNIALVIPCYNEEKRLAVDSVDSFLCSSPVDLVFVDDGSTDGTRRIVSDLAGRHPDRARVVCLQRNSGKAEAVRQGVLASMRAGYPLVGYFDADLSTPLAVSLELAGLLEADGVKLVMGSRVKLMGRDIVRKPLRHYCGRVFATAASLILGLPVYDTQCGAKLFVNDETTQGVFSRPFHVNWTFDVELIWRFCQAYGYPEVPPQRIFVEYPLQAWREVAGSKISLGDLGIISKELLRLWHLVRG